MPRYVVERRTRTGDVVLYWQPSAALRAEGWRSTRLPDERRAAYAVADDLNDKLDRWYRGKGDPNRQKSSAPPRGTVAWCIEEYRRSSFFRDLAVRTRRDYERHLDAIRAWAGAEPVQAVTPRVVYAWREALAKGSQRQGTYRLQVLRLLLAHAVRMGELDRNPAERFRAFASPPRDVVWTDDEVAAFEQHASPEMRLALRLALWTGQRQGDVLRMRWSDIRDGRLEVRQGKTRALVSIPIAVPLAELLNEAARRSLFLLSDRAGVPWQEHAFRKAWNVPRTKAKLERVTFQDLRRTAVCRLGEAGCTVPEIAAITGHRVQDVQRILDVYLKPTRRMADTAIAKLERRS